MLNGEIAKQAAAYIFELFSASLPAELTFHNFRHTLEVVEAVIVIGEAGGLSAGELEILQVAAWFHDSGYCFTYEGHENESMRVADEFLKSINCTAEFIAGVKRLINATRVPQHPEGVMEEIICDADLAHLSKKDYPDYEQRLRKEWQAVLGKSYSEHEWQQLNLYWLMTHHYFSIYGIINFEPGQQVNAAQLSKRMKTL
jgi:uncharacterized protein